MVFILCVVFFLLMNIFPLYKNQKQKQKQKQKNKKQKTN